MAYQKDGDTDEFLQAVCGARRDRTDQIMRGVEYQIEVAILIQVEAMDRADLPVRRHEQVGAELSTAEIGKRVLHPPHGFVGRTTGLKNILTIDKR